MDNNTVELVTSLEKYPNTFNKLLEYFKEVTKNPKFVKENILGLKVALVVPHLIRFCELQKINFLEALIYTNYHRLTPEFAYLQTKTIVVCFHKLEAQKPFNFDLF